MKQPEQGSSPAELSSPSTDTREPKGESEGMQPFTACDLVHLNQTQAAGGSNEPSLGALKV